MRPRVPETASPDELYTEFIRQLLSVEPAVEIAPGVIRITLDHDPDDLDGSPDQWHAFVCITRDQLTSAAWTEFDIFDDTIIDVVPRTATPVATGLVTFGFFTDEMIATLRPDEKYVIYYEGHMHRSTRRSPPPIRGRGDWW